MDAKVHVDFFRKLTQSGAWSEIHSPNKTILSSRVVTVRVRSGFLCVVTDKMQVGSSDGKNGYNPFF